MNVIFTKMHGCGNDYIYFNCFTGELPSNEAISALSVKLSDRHFGIGGDGIVLICPSQIADARMRMFNADGSEGKMCGNAIRCVGKYLYEHHLAVREEITVETLSGVKHLRLHTNMGVVQSVEVDMGRAELESSRIPVDFPQERVIGLPVQIAGGEYAITCVSMGNPHCVVFVEDPEALPLQEIGPRFENAPVFLERINTEFVRVIDLHTLQMRVWERGSGETWACGTGACAAVVAAVENGFCPKGEPVTVRLRGGELSIVYTDETVRMTGGATEVFSGTVAL